MRTLHNFYQVILLEKTSSLFAEGRETHSIMRDGREIQ
jgi:hypothetical protein